MDIKRHYDVNPIASTYKGIKFRSRTEIRWAIFFDRLGWDWRYEYQHYKLPSGNYLPDFYFPDIKAHGEVKPNKFTPLERLKCIELSMMFPDTQVFQLMGVPTLNTIKIIENGANGPDAILVAIWEKFYPLFYINEFDTNYFEETTRAVFEAIEHIF
jgi:hypothetical protein